MNSVKIGKANSDSENKTLMGKEGPGLIIHYDRAISLANIKTVKMVSGIMGVRKKWRSK